MTTYTHINFGVTKIERESEKAALVDLTIDTAVGLKGRKVWFPKKCFALNAAGEFVAPMWFVAKKEAELKAEYPAGAFYGLCGDHCLADGSRD